MTVGRNCESTEHVSVLETLMYSYVDGCHDRNTCWKLQKAFTSSSLQKGRTTLLQLPYKWTPNFSGDAEEAQNDLKQCKVEALFCGRWSRSFRMDMRVVWHINTRWTSSVGSVSQQTREKQQVCSCCSLLPYQSKTERLESKALCHFDCWSKLFIWIEEGNQPFRIRPWDKTALHELGVFEIRFQMTKWAEAIFLSLNNGKESACWSCFVWGRGSWTIVALLSTNNHGHKNPFACWISGDACSFYGIEGSWDSTLFVSQVKSELPVILLSHEPTYTRSCLWFGFVELVLFTFTAQHGWHDENPPAALRQSVHPEGLLGRNRRQIPKQIPCRTGRKGSVELDLMSPGPHTSATAFCHGRRIVFLQIERQAFEYTINQLNSMYVEAETLSSRTYCESCFACLTAYLAYLCMETHYEKVRVSWNFSKTKELRGDCLLLNLLVLSWAFVHPLCGHTSFTWNNASLFHWCLCTESVFYWCLCTELGQKVTLSRGYPLTRTRAYTTRNPCDPVVVWLAGRMRTRPSAAQRLVAGVAITLRPYSNAWSCIPSSLNWIPLALPPHIIAIWFLTSAAVHCKFLLFQMLKKIARFIQDQNNSVYVPRGLMLIDPAERGLRIVSFSRRHSCCSHGVTLSLCWVQAGLDWFQVRTDLRVCDRFFQNRKWCVCLIVLLAKQRRKTRTERNLLISSSHSIPRVLVLDRFFSWSCAFWQKRPISGNRQLWLWFTSDIARHREKPLVTQYCLRPWSLVRAGTKVPARQEGQQNRMCISSNSWTLWKHGGLKLRSTYIFEHCVQWESRWIGFTRVQILCVQLVSCVHSERFRHDTTFFAALVNTACFVSQLPVFLFRGRREHSDDSTRTRIVLTRASGCGHRIGKM